MSCPALSCPVLSCSLCPVLSCPVLPACRSACLPACLSVCLPALPVLLLLTGSCMQSSADWLALSPLALFMLRRLWRRADTSAALPVLLVLTGSGLANQRELALRFLRRLLRGCVGACVCFAAVLPPSVCASVCRGACSVACRVAACPACPSGPRGCGPPPPFFLCCWFLAGVAPWWLPGPWGSWPRLAWVGPLLAPKPVFKSVPVLSMYRGHASIFAKASVVPDL